MLSHHHTHTHTNNYSVHVNSANSVLCTIHLTSFTETATTYNQNNTVDIKDVHTKIVHIKKGATRNSNTVHMKSMRIQVCTPLQSGNILISLKYVKNTIIFVCLLQCYTQ